MALTSSPPAFVRSAAVVPWHYYCTVPRSRQSIATHIEQDLVRIAGVKVVANNIGEGHLLRSSGER